MVSIMSDREIDRKSASSDISFSGVDTLPEERGSPRRSPLMDDFDKARVLDLDLEDGDSENSGMVLSGSSEPPSVGVRVSESEAWRAVGGSGSRASREAALRWMNGLKVGDMVWGKVKSHPWWPGHIFNEAFASPSVRRSRREGHVLVAFFGDSSYGWFDPAELIPFEPHFAEKSSQTNSRTFVKAVEEAVDEVSRRGALPLACHCRSPNNFRPTAVPGYFSVDVTGFEPGGVYSSEQIENARDNFQPAEALSFVQQLALAPQRNMSSRSVDWIKSMSSLLAYRRAVYEEFDETYAQAFGVQPVRPSKNDSGVPNQPTRAPLSGPLVIAEELGDKKSSTKFAKTPSTSKKNKYVLKRRDETQTTTPPLPDLRAERKPHGATGDYYFDLAPGQQPQASVVISSLPAFREAATTAVPSSTSANASQTDNYVLQKRVPAEKMQPVPAMPEDGQAEGQSQKQLITQPVNKAADTDSHDGCYSTPQLPTVHPSAVDTDLDDWMLKSQQQPQERPIAEGDPKIGAIGTPSDLWQDDKPPATSKQGAIDITQSKFESHSLTGDQPAMGVAPVAFGPPFAKAQNAGVVLDGAVKKEKARKRLPGDDTGEVRKKKKKKKTKHDESSTDRLIETPKDVEHRRKVAGKSEIELQSREPAEAVRAASLPKLDVIDSTNLELPQLLTDLSALALDPFYGMERSAPDVVRHVFLRFRSMVYQKALVLPPPPGENEVPVVRPTKPAETKTRTSDVKELKPPSKPISRLDDPTKAGRKRGPSDRQEELSAKRIKKVKLLKALSREKKGGIKQKPPEGPKPAAAAGTTATLAKPWVAPAEPVKKREPPPPPRAPSPTFLVMKFPPRSTLPSVASLKARFARFGTLDLEATRVYWKSHTCKVLFKYKSDAEDACNYGKSNELFGQFKVSYYTRELEEPGKQQKEPGADDGFLQLRPGNGGPPSQPRPPQRLKSILKKPGDEAGTGTPGGGIVKDSQRVKFMLGGGGDGRKEPPAPPPVAVVNSNNYGSGSPFPPPEPVSKNPKSVNFLPPSSPPPPPLSLPHHRPFYPPPMSQSPHVPDMHQFSPVSPAPASVFQPFHAPDVQWFPPPPLSQLSQPPPRFIDGFDNRGLSPFSEAQPLRIPFPHNGESEVKADISHQMLSLLLRCSDIVTSVKSSLGYVPYRPL